MTAWYEHAQGGETDNPICNNGPMRKLEGTRTIIHRDGTFAYGGDQYRVLNNGPGWGYQIVSVPDLKPVAEVFFLLAEVRDYVDKARRQGWLRLGEDVVVSGNQARADDAN
jgi:hypothetical protein